MTKTKKTKMEPDTKDNGQGVSQIANDFPPPKTEGPRPHNI